MKVNVTVRFYMKNLELPDTLDPMLLNKRGWRTRYGSFYATEGPDARPKGPYDREPDLFVQAARAELEELLAKHGASALCGHVEIVPEDAREC
jgi:hypothetical protein